MPIYAYRCAACRHTLDVLQKISDPLLTRCPACGADEFRKQVTAAGFQLKGSGWYVTDFKGDGQKKAKGAGDAAADGGGDAAAATPSAPEGEKAKPAEAPTAAEAGKSAGKSAGTAPAAQVVPTTSSDAGGSSA